MPGQSTEFEELLITPLLVAGLYGNSLVIINENDGNAARSAPAKASLMKEKIKTGDLPGEVEHQATTPPEHVSSINFLGDFSQKIAVFVEDPDNRYLAETEFDLLVKMLQAVKCSIADIALINIAGQPAQWQLIEKKLGPERAIFFGVDPFTLGVPMRIPLFRVHRWGSTFFLYSPSLAELNTTAQNQTQLKKDLWKALQELFS